VEYFFEAIDASRSFGSAELNGLMTLAKVGSADGGREDSKVSSVEASGVDVSSSAARASVVI
jgi:hypothetical protein